MDKRTLATNIELEDTGGFHFDLQTKDKKEKQCCSSWVNTITCRLLCVGILLAIVSCFIWIIVCTSGACDGQKCLMDCTATDHSPWDYSKHSGPECWGTCYSICSTGKRQSPIDIKSSQTTAFNFSSPLKLQGYNQSRTVQLLSNGRTVLLELPEPSVRISGLSLRGEYIAAQLHFHWGKNKHKGSEHTFSGDFNAMEMDIVHYSADYASLAEATYHPDGLAVLAFMIEISDDQNEAFDVIVENLHKVSKPGKRLNLHNITLAELLPEQHTSAYRYEGSLTTPGCTEHVIWTVFRHHIALTEQQIKTFQKSIYTDSSSDAKILKENNRPVQELNERTILHGDINVDIS